MIIQVFTDGSATIASKPGGFGWVLVVDEVKHSEGNGHLPKATNNDAEMEAAIHGLIACYKFIQLNKCNDPNCQDGVVFYDIGGPHHQAGECPMAHNIEVVLCSDSQIVLNWANGTNRFKQTAKIKRYEVLVELMRRLKAKTQWVRGHSGNVHNERCDVLANLGRHKLGANENLPGKTKNLHKIDKKMALTVIKNIYNLVETSELNLAGLVRKECEKVLKELK